MTNPYFWIQYYALMNFKLSTSCILQVEKLHYVKHVTREKNFIMFPFHTYTISICVLSQQKKRKNQSKWHFIQAAPIVWCYLCLLIIALISQTKLIYYLSDFYSFEKNHWQNIFCVVMVYIVSDILMYHSNTYLWPRSYKIRTNCHINCVLVHCFKILFK